MRPVSFARRSEGVAAGSGRSLLVGTEGSIPARESTRLFGKQLLFNSLLLGYGRGKVYLIDLFQINTMIGTYFIHGFGNGGNLYFILCLSIV